MCEYKSVASTHVGIIKRDFSNQKTILLAEQFPMNSS